MPDMWTIEQCDLSGNTRSAVGHRLGRNEFGLWLYVPGEAQTPDAAGTKVDTACVDRALLVPDGEPWITAWGADGSIRADVTVRSPVITGRLVSCAVLGLSVAIEDGRTRARVLGSYDEAVLDGRISPQQDEAARSTLAGLVQQVTEGAEPFGRAGHNWLTGVARNELHFIDYDPAWPRQFEQARQQMLPVLPPGSRVEHVGSTAVPGLSAKDCVDIAIVVPDAGQVEPAITALERSGYEARPNAFGDPEHVFLRRLTDGRRSHHLHLYTDGHPNLVEVIAFRDLLRADPGARQRYQQVKRSLAESNPYDRGGYLAGKSEVVLELLQVALRRSGHPGDRQR